MLMTLVSLNIFAAESIANKVTKLNWNGLDVVWINEDRYPTYNISVYYGDGALSDNSSRRGETEMMFNFLDIGTRRYSQMQIADALDFYGVTYNARVTHEYSTFSMKGLVKDIVPTLKMVCHMVNNATYPKKILHREKNRMKNAFSSLLNDKRELASRAFRKLSLRNTPYQYSTDGSLKTLRKISSKNLILKKDYFQKRVSKVLYLTGPKEVLKIREIINKECGWENQKNLFSRRITYKENKISGPMIYLITVPKANQAQIRMGRFLNKSELGNDELMTLSAGFLGGGFTSLLMREVRVKRGLTYSINAFAGAQAEYGRVGISSFTKNETVTELIKVVRDTLSRVGRNEFKLADFKRAQGYLIGSYPFRFEESSDFLQQLISLDHVKKTYDNLYRFPETVSKLSSEDVAKNISKLFDWNKMTIVVLGEKKLSKQLRKLGQLKIISHKKFL